MPPYTVTGALVDVRLGVSFRFLNPLLTPPRTVSEGDVTTGMAGGRPTVLAQNSPAASARTPGLLMVLYQTRGSSRSLSSVSNS
jgi:hypothetical protein